MDLPVGILAKEEILKLVNQDMEAALVPVDDESTIPIVTQNEEEHQEDHHIRDQKEQSLKEHLVRLRLCYAAWGPP